MPGGAGERASPVAWIILAILPLAAVIAILPVADWLHLRHVGNGEARLVLEFFYCSCFR